MHKYRLTKTEVTKLSQKLETYLAPINNRGGVVYP